MMVRDRNTEEKQLAQSKSKNRTPKSKIQNGNPNTDTGTRQTYTGALPVHHAMLPPRRPPSRGRAAKDVLSTFCFGLRRLLVLLMDCEKEEVNLNLFQIHSIGQWCSQCSRLRLCPVPTDFFYTRKAHITAVNTHSSLLVACDKGRPSQRSFIIITNKHKRYKLTTSQRPISKSRGELQLLCMMIIRSHHHNQSHTKQTKKKEQAKPSQASQKSHHHHHYWMVRKCATNTKSDQYNSPCLYIPSLPLFSGSLLRLLSSSTAKERERER